MSYAAFDEYLDNVNAQVEIGQNYYSPAYVLKTVDPETYENEYQDFMISFSTD